MEQVLQLGLLTRLQPANIARSWRRRSGRKPQAWWAASIWEREGGRGTPWLQADPQLLGGPCPALLPCPALPCPASLNLYPALPRTDGAKFLLAGLRNLCSAATPRHQRYRVGSRPVGVRVGIQSWKQEGKNKGFFEQVLFALKKLQINLIFSFSRSCN